MRKRFIAFMLAIVIVSLDLGNVFANTVTVLDPVMADKPNVEAIKDNDSSPVQILDSRDKDNNILENSPSILQNPLELGARDNGKGDREKNKNDKEVLGEALDKNSSKNSPKALNERENKGANQSTKTNPNLETNSSINSETNSKSNSPSIQDNPEREDLEQLVSVVFEFVVGNKVFKTETLKYKDNELVDFTLPEIKGYTKLNDSVKFTAKEGEVVKLNYEEALDLSENLIQDPVGAPAPWDEEMFTVTDIESGVELSGFSEKGLEKLKNVKTLVLPDAINGKDVISIKDHAFYKKDIESLVFGSKIVSIGSYAFSQSKIKILSFPESLRVVGDYAFRDNLIQEIDTKNIDTISEGAFSNNRIEKLTFGDSLTNIGSHAFEQNDLVKVNISNNVTAFGTSVFAFNNRYVKVETENPIIKTEKTYRGFGHIVNPVIIKVKYIDKDTKEEIIDSKTMGEDLTVEGGVFILGEENILYPEKIKGYYIQDEVKFTPDKDNYELTLEYTSLKKKPTIEIADLRMLNIDEKVDKELLLSFIKATDLTGKDISDRVAVTPETIDTSTGGIKKVTYTVTDEYGNTEVKEVDIPVAIDWFKYPIGNGWVLGDFTYDGNTVTGFSEQGKEKVKTNKDLVIPRRMPDRTSTQYSALKPVTTIGDSAFRYNKLTSVVISEGLTTIGNSAFSNNQFTNVVIGDSVITIGDNAFSSNRLSSVIIPDSVITIGDDAFLKNKLVDVVIGDGVKTIGKSSFSWHNSKIYCNRIKFLKLGKSVTTIGDEAFYQNQLTSVVIPDSVTIIGDSAFSKNQLINLSMGNNLNSIGGKAFEVNKLTTVNIPLSLKTIGEKAFWGNLGIDKLHNVSLLTLDKTNPNNLQNENTRDKGSVYISSDARGTKDVIDYPGGHIVNPIALLKVNYVDDKNNQLDISSEGMVSEKSNIVFPKFEGYCIEKIEETGEQLSDYTKVFNDNGQEFVEWTIVYKRQILKINYINEKGEKLRDSIEVSPINNQVIDFPKIFGHNIVKIKETGEQLSDYTKVFNDNGQEFVEWTIVYKRQILKINYINEKGEILKNSIETFVADEQEIVFPKILGYDIREIRETGEQLTRYSKTLRLNGQNFLVWTIVYEKEKPQINDGVVLKTWLNPSTSKDPYNYYIGEEQRLYIKFNITKDLPNINNMEVKVQIPDVVDNTSILIPSHSNIKEFKVDGNILSIKLQNIINNTSMEIPVLFKMNRYTTPENTDFKLRTILVDNSGEYLCSVFENNFTGFYRKPKLDVCAGTILESWVDGPRVLGNMKYVNGDTSKKRIEESFDFDFKWEVKTDNRSILDRNLDRNIESYTIETELPKYIAYDDNGKEITKTSTFKQELNEGWVLNGDKLTYTEKNLNTNSPNYKKLTLSFPEAKDGTQIDLNAKITFTPKNKAEKENNFIINDKITIYAVGETIVTSSFLHSSPQVRWSWKKGDHLYDIPVDREKTVPWSFELSKNYSNAEFKNLNAEITELDNRFEYKSITNTGNDELIFKIYKNGKQVDEISLQGKEESKKLPQGIDKIEVSSIKDSIIDTASFYLKIKNKEPNKNISASNVSLHLSGTVDTKKENGEEIKQTTNGYDGFDIYDLEHELRADINAKLEKEGFVEVGKIVNYSIGLRQNINIEENYTEFFDEDLVNFKQVVVLPQNAHIKEITVSEGFKDSPKSRYRIVDLGEGYQAVVFEAEKLKQKTYNIANIEILITNSMREGKHTTETYATWDNKDIVKESEVNIPERIAQILSGKASATLLEYSLVFVKAVYSEKYVKDTNGLYRISSITNDGNIDYQLKVVNSEDGNRTNVTILDILPFKGDDRGSQLDVFLREKVTIPNGEVFYTTDKHPTENSNFTETYSEGVTAVKIIVSSINANSTFVVDLKCKISLPSKIEELIKLSNKFAFNDFSRKDDLTDTFVKTNPVETKYMLGNASIEFSKFGLKKSIFFNNYKKKPLAGAKFELKDLDGNYIASATSDSNGKVTFTDVDVNDYIIREVKAPKGYEVGKDIRVLTSDYQLVDGKVKAILEDEVINNAPRYGNLTINKVTATNKPLQGIGFTIKGTDDTNKDYIRKITTNQEGKATLSKIPEGNYKVEETESGIFIPAEPQTFKIEQSQDELILDDQEINLKFVNDKIKVRINKFKIPSTKSMPTDFTNLSVTNKTLIPGVQFNINGKEYTTNKDGYIEFETTTNSDIIIKELSNSDIYVNPNNIAFVVKATDDGNLTNEEGEKYLYGTINIPNQLKHKIIINKVEYGADEEIPQDLINVQKFNRKLIPNIVFNINGKEYITNKNGFIEFWIETGQTFTLEETKTTNAYKSDNIKATFKITDSGQLTDLNGNIFYNSEINIPNKIKKVKCEIEVFKEDTEKNPLQNAEFVVTKTTGVKDEIGVFKTDQEGKLQVKLEPGNYEIREKNSPYGYFNDGFKKEITIPENPNDIKNVEENTDTIMATLQKENYDIYVSEDEYIIRKIKYTIVNKPINVEVLKYETILKNVIKDDITQYENKEEYKIIQNETRYSVVKPLQGVKFDLYEDDVKVGSYQTGTDGYINFNNYKFKENGIYSLVETETLDGFKLEKTPTRINIKSLSKVEGFDGNININIENKRLTGKIIISKSDKTKLTVLPGQEFTLYDSTGKEISKKVTNSAGLIEFNELPLGVYTFKETKTTEDYILDDKIYSANITKDNLMHIERIFNKPNKTEIKVTKVDSQGNPLEGVEFAIFKDGKMVYGPVKTNKNGIAIFEGVKIEDDLVIKETATIKNYQLNQEEITLDLQGKEQVEVKYTNHKAEKVLPDTGTLNELPFIGIAILLLSISIFLRKRKIIIK